MRGITPVFFTATAWGGAIAPEGFMPMWGGYAFRPWMLFEDGTHPMTDEYVYQDFHRNGVETTYDFHPRYLPESKPYCCCEIGGGMMIGYTYRFQYPMKSVDAIANIKMASGCNFLGYYMYHGGSNPISRSGAYTNDGNLPKISYDYHAAIGEYGQIRESYRRAKNVHYFAETFEQQLCRMETVLPSEASGILPQQLDSLRYAVRTDGRSGFLFVNNFQDHGSMTAKEGEQIVIQLPEECLSFSISMDMDENGIFPFHMDLDGIDLIKATAQPITKTMVGDTLCYFFFLPAGSRGVFLFEESARVRESGTSRYEADQAAQLQSFTVEKDGKSVPVIVLDRNLANRFYLLDRGGAILTEAAVMEDEDGVRLESEKESEEVFLLTTRYRRTEAVLQKADFDASDSIASDSRVSDALETMPGFEKVLVKMTSQDDLAQSLPDAPKEAPQDALLTQEVAPGRYLIHFPEHCFEGRKDLRLQVDYTGDIGNLFLDYELIGDNYSNGAVWEIGLAEWKDRLPGKELLLYLCPIKKGRKIIIDNQMAAEKEVVEEEIQRINSLRLQPVYEKVILV